MLKPDVYIEYYLKTVKCNLDVCSEICKLKCLKGELQGKSCKLYHCADVNIMPFS